MNFSKAKKVKLRDYADESWLQNQIEQEPSILGLGDLIVLRREKRQSSGGRLDFLLFDSEANTMYEVELMLGATDESHIIRTIEYWDIETRKNPSKEHRAVIVAEQITSRFFNVIYLMNRAIPIIAVQLEALLVDGKLVLHFTKVLDVYETPEDSIALAAEPTNRAYWEARSNAESLAASDSIIALCKQLYSQLKVTWNQGHIALGTQKQNFCWLHLRKRQIHCHVYLNVGADNTDKAKAILEETAIPFGERQDDLSFDLSVNSIEEKMEPLKQLFKLGIQEHS